jgi:DNA polymerase IV
MRTIFHLDMDAFFVSVEELYDPTLKGKPVVVGGQPGQRGVVSAASYEARRFGVHSAMPLRRAYQLCPHAIFLDGHPHHYREYSHRVYRILGTFTPVVEMASIDEAYLDMTGTDRLHGPPFRAAHLLRDAVWRETGLPCSIGIATSRLVAKISSDQAKPKGILWVLPGQEASFLAPLEVRRLPGVGPRMEEHLHRYGIRRVGDLANLEEWFLREKFGQWGLALAGKSHGLDAGGWFDHAVGAEELPKSISHEHTFGHDTTDETLMEATLAQLSGMVGRRLREHGLHARTVQLKLRYHDFTTITRAHTLDHATQLDHEIALTVRELFQTHWTQGSLVRLLGVHASSLEPYEGQMNLLEEEKSRRWRRALSAADRLRDKFGEAAISLASTMEGQWVEKTHENPAGLPGRRKKEREE